MSDESNVAAPAAGTRLLRQEAGEAPQKAAVYARRASSKAGSGGVDDQIQACREYATSLGVEVVQTYEHVNLIDGGEHRPSLDHLMADAAAGMFDILIIADFYELSRDAVHLDEVIRRLESLSVSVHAVVSGPVRLLDAAFAGRFALISREAKRAAWRRRKLSVGRLGVAGARHV